LIDLTTYRYPGIYPCWQMMADTKDDSNLDDNKSDGGVEEDNGNFG
jgi:hypothetical protein